MTKHTSGPWHIQDNSDQEFGQIRVDSDEGAVAFCGNNFGPLADLEGMRANAHLIAAAPELLEALKSAAEAVGSEFCSHTGKCSVEIEECAAAEYLLVIAKAEGEK